MARMHSRKKGKSGSTRPVERTKPEWVTISKKELEMLIVKLAKEGMTSAQIGAYLRDTHGIPDVSVILEKKIYAFIKEKELNKAMPEDLRALMAKAFELRKHTVGNGQDKVAKRGITLTDSKINRLVKYYKENGTLEATFRYRPADLNLYLD